MVTSYQPARGDFIYLDFTPQAGAEQAGRRPALVISPERYNVATGLAFVCPVTNQVKGNPFEVPIPPDRGISGVVLANQLRSLDWLARNAAFENRAPTKVVEDVVEIVEAIIG